MALQLDQSEDTDDPSFYWWYEDTDKPVPLTLPSCSQVQFGVGPNPNSTAPSTHPPYTLLIYPAGFPARRYEAGQAGNISWTVDLPEGTPILLQFVDAQGHAGGTSPLTTITSGLSQSCLDSSSSSHNNDNTADASLAFTFDPETPSTCQDVQVSVDGGEPPYTLTVVRAGLTAVNVTRFASKATWTNTLSGGAGAMYAVSDSNGNYATVPDAIFSQGGTNKTCLSDSSAQPIQSHGSSQTDGSSSSSSSKGTSGAVIGGAVAGVVLALLVGVGVGFLFFQRRKKRSTRAHNRLSVPSSFMHPDHYRSGSSDNWPRRRSNSSRPSPRPFSSSEEMQPPRFNFRVLNPDPASDTSTVAPDDASDRYSISSWGPGPSADSHDQHPDETFSFASMPSTISGARDMSTAGYSHSRQASLADDASTTQKRKSCSLHSVASGSTISEHWQT